MFLTFLAVVLVSAFILYFILVLPIWSLIECVKSHLSILAKIIWVICLVFLWPISALVYGGWLAKNKFLKISSRILAMLVFSFVLIFCFVLMPYLANTLAGNAQQSQKTLPQFLESKQIDQTQYNELNFAFGILSEEAGGNWTKKIERIIVGIDLCELFNLYIKDNHLSALEYQEWMQKFRQRNTLTEKELRKFIRQTRIPKVIQ